MAQLEVSNIVKIYPFVKPSLIGGKRAKKQREMQIRAPHTTNEGVIALQEVSFGVEQGEFLVILGESGCGKSTLLRIIAGLTDATLGSVTLEGQDITNARPEQRDMAMIFQGYALYPHLTAYENMAFPLTNQHVPREEIEKKVLPVAMLLGIENLLDRRPGELSGGEQQRVAIGRAVVREPKLFLMDEPFSNLDVNLRRQMRMVIREVYETLGVSFLYVTHDQNEAMSLGTRILLLRDGEVEQIGTPKDLYDHPATVYAARFIGTPGMNILQAEGSPVLFGIRPEAVRMSHWEDARASEVTAPMMTDSGLTHLENIRLTGKVLQTEHLGGEIHISVDLDADLPLQVSDAETKGIHPFIIAIPADGSKGMFIPGDSVELELPKERLLFFDVETGKRMETTDA